MLKFVEKKKRRKKQVENLNTKIHSHLKLKMESDKDFSINSLITERNFNCNEKIDCNFRILNINLIG